MVYRKRTMSMLSGLLFALTILYPVGVFITACFGYSFELISVSAFAVMVAILSMWLVFRSVVSKSTVENSGIQVLLACITPLSLVNAALVILDCPRIWVVASVLVSSGCSCCLAIKHGKPLILKMVAFGLSAIMLLLIGFLGFVVWVFGDIGQNTIVKTLESPSGEYYAQVMDSDQGALGGDTFVDVYQKRGIHACFFKIEKKAQRVYWGDWGEFADMQIYWKNDRCLVINSVEYEIE